MYRVGIGKFNMIATNKLSHSSPTRNFNRPLALRAMAVQPGAWRLRLAPQMNLAPQADPF